MKLLVLPPGEVDELSEEGGEIEECAASCKPELLNHRVYEYIDNSKPELLNHRVYKYIDTSSKSELLNP